MATAARATPPLFFARGSAPRNLRRFPPSFGDVCSRFSLLGSFLLPQGPKAIIGHSMTTPPPHLPNPIFFHPAQSLTISPSPPSLPLLISKPPLS